MSDFNLRDHIRETLAATAEENLSEITYIIYASIPCNAIREALKQALPEVVRKELAIAPRLDHACSDTQTLAVEPGQSTDGGEARESPSPISASLPPVGNIRNSRAALFRRNRFRISVWIGAGTYRQILDCTRTDLEFAAAENDRQAHANEVTARRYRRLAKAMVERDVETVAELTDAEIEEALRDE